MCSVVGQLEWLGNREQMLEIIPGTNKKECYPHWEHPVVAVVVRCRWAFWAAGPWWQMSQCVWSSSLQSPPASAENPLSANTSTAYKPYNLSIPKAALAPCIFFCPWLIVLNNNNHLNWSLLIILFLHYFQKDHTWWQGASHSQTEDAVLTNLPVLACVLWEWTGPWRRSWPGGGWAAAHSGGSHKVSSAVFHLLPVARLSGSHPM